MFEPGDHIKPNPKRWHVVHDHFKKDGCTEAIVVENKNQENGPKTILYRCAIHDDFTWEGYTKNWVLSGNSDDQLLTDLLK